MELDTEVVILSDGDFLNAILQKLHCSYEYPKYSAKEILKRKQVMVFSLWGATYVWERKLLKQEQIAIAVPVKKMFDSIVRYILTPALQEHYHSSVEKIYLTEPTIENQRRKGYVVVVFEKPVFGRDEHSIIPKGLEDQLSNKLAKSIRALTGKGPNSIQSVILDPETSIHVINGILSPYEQKHTINTFLPSMALNVEKVNGNLPFGTTTSSNTNVWLNLYLDGAIKEAIFACYDWVKRAELNYYTFLDASRNQLCILVKGNLLINK